MLEAPAPEVTRIAVSAARVICESCILKPQTRPSEHLGLERMPDQVEAAL
ncbi:MAG: hypothetical protein H5U40_08690 [Polyangiaceae bacterium]|nr:hypothetical protein [Polyangiaceae bacterium]